ncbi:tannase and feruloyl esterase [Sporormia fimetaria CBS 119925]|uniref:Carboxylic ester hydrolase n=1 Tax=Sporormia fimetaria CBS 119925 TaxID=1340428 RepID=A0A6A6UZ71_9PLEO|nr:tannase and feruloyl esterase [Sporormia fimetaria CBS 119925]
MWFSILLPLVLPIIHATTSPSPSFAEKCTSFSLTNHPLSSHPNATLINAEFLPANSTLPPPPNLHPTCLADQLSIPLTVPMCRLSLHIPTSPSSAVNMEIWLPPPETWTKRFLSTGNGGLGGCIQYPDLLHGASLGFATAGHDNGHNPEVLRDFVDRSVVVSTEAGVEITRQFYGYKRGMKRYHSGCSQGGRQGWKAVQEHPGLFDGVVAGAPGLSFNTVIAWHVWVLANVLKGGHEGFLEQEDWEEVTRRVMEMCDADDGVVDGIIEDTRRCRPDLRRFKCRKDGRKKEGQWCLTEAQLETLYEWVYKPWKVDGKVEWPGVTPGAESLWAAIVSMDGWKSLLEESMKYIYQQDPSYNISLATLQDAVNAIRMNPFDLATFGGDLSAFQRRGGKVVHWHGQLDQTLHIANSDRYYDHVSRTMKKSSRELDVFYRYFRISGMQHCFGGPGANAIGQFFGLGASERPEDNVIMALYLRGAKFQADDYTQEVVFSRKHCRYPKRNRYFGAGDGTDEEGRRCIAA